jgi:hypothetical protein
MARGSIAKTVVEEKIKAAFGSDFVGISDKKLYVQADDGGEKVQIAISLTCPKIPLNSNLEANAMDMSNVPTTGTTFQPAEITNEETENIKRMMAELGL